MPDQQDGVHIARERIHHTNIVPYAVSAFATLTTEERFNEAAEATAMIEAFPGGLDPDQIEAIRREERLRELRTNQPVNMFNLMDFVM